MTRCILAALIAVPMTAEGQQRCDRLATTVFPGITITSATSIPAGPFTLPTIGASSVNSRAFCRVVAVVPPEVKFELWMPSQWNHKLLGVGNGGLAGTISYEPMLKPLQRGYATSSTDTGHAGLNTSDGTWALGHYQRIVDFADRGIHVMAEANKVILRAFYGEVPEHSYFNGCSQGGHEALIEAQRYPSDYDGIIAGAPANNWTRHYSGGHMWTAMAIEGGGYIPATKVQLIADAVNDECDALDGIKDGVLNDPRRCHFDPAKLLCAGDDAPDCLTAAQVAAVHKLWTGLRDAEGDQIYPGLVPGGEGGPGGWTRWISGTAPGANLHATLGIPFFKYIVFDNPDWDYHTFRFDASNGFDSDVDYTDAKLGALFNATSPDLTAFKSRGGKLIHYHGWSDADITPLNSVQYYEQVANFVGRGGNHGVRDTKAFYRLFMVPGMQHCGGGPGPATFDMLEPLEQWVERGLAPERVTASDAVNGSVTRTRPLCAYPREARWKRTGSTDDAANFECVLPSR